MARTLRNHNRRRSQTLWWLAWISPEATGGVLLVFAAIGSLLGITQTWRLHRRRDRIRRGLCAVCGYDLRASKNRCPECGQMIPIPAPTSVSHTWRAIPRARI
jgi:hypothetical protein